MTVRLAAGALFVAMTLAAPSAAAQAPAPGPAPAQPTPPAPPRGPVKQLPQLRAEAEAAEKAYSAALEARLAIQSDYLTHREARVELVSKQGELVAQGAPRSKILEVQTQLATVSAKQARAGHALEDARAEELVRRLAAIRADVAVADRAFEKADDTLAPGRAQDAPRLVEEANDYLQRAERLRARGDEPTAEDPPALDPSGLEPDQLRLELAEFQEYAERAEERVAELEPDRAQLERSVAHLGRWRARLPHQADLPVRLERAQQELDRLRAVLEKERERAARHRRHVQALEAELGKRIREEGEPPR